MTYDPELLVSVDVVRELALTHALHYSQRLTELVPEEESTFDRGYQDLVYRINKMAQRASETLEARPR